MAKTTTDHDEIRRWVEEHGGHPARVKRTRGKNDSGLLRIDFPGFSGRQTLEEISWNEFFQGFDANKLAFLYEDQGDSRFNKLIGRDTAAARARGEHVSRHKPASRRRFSEYEPSREFGSSRGATRARGSARAAAPARRSSTKRGSGRPTTAKRTSGRAATAKRGSARSAGARGRRASAGRRA